MQTLFSNKIDDQIKQTKKMFILLRTAYFFKFFFIFEFCVPPNLWTKEMANSTELQPDLTINRPDISVSVLISVSNLIFRYNADLFSHNQHQCEGVAVLRTLFNRKVSFTAKNWFVNNVELRTRKC